MRIWYFMIDGDNTWRQMTARNQDELIRMIEALHPDYEGLIMKEGPLVTGVIYI